MKNEDSCPYCGSTLHYQLINKSFDGTEIIRCDNCGQDVEVTCSVIFKATKKCATDKEIDRAMSWCFDKEENWLDDPDTVDLLTDFITDVSWWYTESFNSLDKKYTFTIIRGDRVYTYSDKNRVKALCAAFLMWRYDAKDNCIEVNDKKLYFPVKNKGE